MTHQSASTVNETPGAAVQRTLRRAFFPTEELYFEVHRICLYLPQQQEPLFISQATQWLKSRATAQFLHS